LEGKTVPLDISRELGQIQNVPGSNWLYLALQKVMKGVNSLAENVGADVNSLDPPPQIQGINVKSSGTGLVHVVLSDSSPIKRNIQYFVECDTSPSFTQPHVEHLGASRDRVLRLPGMNDASAAQTFYIRGYSQYYGSSKPSKPLVYVNPSTGSTAVLPGGTDTLTLLPSTGSGTANNNGLEGNSGLGRVLRRVL
jgi:hypothetical protein